MTYTHYKKKGKYKIIERGEMQIEDVWFECIIYRCLSSGKVYVREMEDFNLKFECCQNVLFHF